MILAGTGHRPQKLGFSEHIQGLLLKLAIFSLRDIKPDKIISGMALGWDMALAEASISLDIPFTAAVPFIGQETIWPIEAQSKYKALLNKATEIKIISPGGYSPAKMQIRNIFMVDAADTILALWDGSKGGTCNCVKYAKKVKKPITNCWDKWVELLNA